MTVIAVIKDKKTGEMWTFSDAMVTTAKDGPNSRLQTPLVRGVHEVSGLREVGLCRKFVRVHERLSFFFAGRVLAAKSIYKTLRSYIEAGGDISKESVSECIAECYPAHDLAGEALIFFIHPIDRAKSISIFWIGCNVIENDDCLIISGGSGDYYLNQEDICVGDEISNLAIAESGKRFHVLAQLLAYILRSGFDEAFPYFATGGWFEIGHVTRRAVEFIDYQLVVLPGEGFQEKGAPSIVGSRYFGDIISIFDFQEYFESILEGRDVNPARIFKIISPVAALDQRWDGKFSLSEIACGNFAFHVIVSIRKIESKVSVQASVGAGSAFSGVKFFPGGFEAEPSEAMKAHFGNWPQAQA